LFRLPDEHPRERTSAQEFAVDNLDERTHVAKEPGAEPIPGYRLVSPLGRGGFGVVWKCEAPGGLAKAMKFVQGGLDSLDDEVAPADEELRALQLVKAIRHPFLLSLERVELVGGELVIVMELADQSLQDVLEEHQRAGRPGIPRERLLGYMREAAEALDVMNVQHGLQHLDIKPGNLFLVSHHIKVADFGLVNSGGGTEGSARRKLGSITPRYAAPEVFAGGLSAHSDQYSLAIVYQQLLTNTLPFTGQNARQLLVQHTCEEPDLSSLPAADRAVATRALAKDPARRFPTCSDFVRALFEGDRAGAFSDGGAGVHCVGLPDYRFLECLSCTPLAEAWKVKAPDGRKRLVQFVYGFARRDGEWEAALRFKALRHRSLRQVEVVQYEPGRLALLADHIEKSLEDRLRECQKAGLPGIPRAELLGYLRVVAETLQQLFRQHSALHLGLNPKTVLLDDGRPIIADMGLAHLLWRPAGQAIASLNARYAAPELTADQPEAASDQYSLALLYQELLTGIHPFAGQAEAPRLGWWRSRPKPNLRPLPEGDRDIIARALHPNPRRRFSSCPEFVLALAVGAARPRSKQSHGATALSEAYGPEGWLRRRYKSRLPLEVIRPRLDAFRLNWQGQAVRDEMKRLVFRFHLPRSFWLSRQTGLEVDVNLAQADAGTPTEVTVQIQAFGCSPTSGAELVRDMGALLLESVRTYLQVNPEQRIQERLIWPHPLLVRALYDDDRLGEPIQGQGKDISLGGVGFYLPEELPTSRVQVELAAPGAALVRVAARVARVQRCGDSWFEVGTQFVPTEGQQKAIVALIGR
jgi:serine/threonine protein kinase